VHARRWFTATTREALSGAVMMCLLHGHDESRNSAHSECGFVSNSRAAHKLRSTKPVRSGESSTLSYCQYELSLPIIILNSSLTESQRWPLWHPGLFTVAVAAAASRTPVRYKQPHYVRCLSSTATSSDQHLLAMMASSWLHACS
jgi:hypothetical protein